ncbi:MAG: tRNA (pseudouridine(54)-N(1))-methyltransferase TrmY [Candidatus Aenigmarchaeota archaeon]|nr:tRNA (pseudouridine(54)-N(1))-methyltransferase TrmY [Candidatus Aenigmarchaeota archaeon]MBU5689217.1 tRNA (pseudouridine(54)-N(1))-methyltransferase TrmY [Candidatus Aenigmarchaeota archaeon]
MREFLLKSNGVTGDFSLNDLPGAGRMDVVCRAVTACLWLSDQLRKDTIFHALLEGKPSPPKLLTFDPKKLKRLYPDERNVAAHIRLSLLGRKMPGIEVNNISFEDFLKQQNKQKQIIFLDKDGKDIRDFIFEKDVLFILGDHKGLKKEDIKGEKMSVGKKIYLASQVISIIQNELDRREE